MDVKDSKSKINNSQPLLKQFKRIKILPETTQKSKFNFYPTPTKMLNKSYSPSKNNSTMNHCITKNRGASLKFSNIFSLITSMIKPYSHISQACRTIPSPNRIANMILKVTQRRLKVWSVEEEPMQGNQTASKMVRFRT